MSILGKELFKQHVNSYSEHLHTYEHTTMENARYSTNICIIIIIVVRFGNLVILLLFELMTQTLLWTGSP